MSLIFNISFSLLEILQTRNDFSSIEILKLGCINSLNYKTILESCPQLISLDIGIAGYYKTLPFNSVHEHQLQRLILRIGDIFHSSIDDILSNYLSVVPYLHELTIHLVIYDFKILESYISYDWFKSLVDKYLKVIRKFRVDLYFREDEEKKKKTSDNLHLREVYNRIFENFSELHFNNYQSYLIIH